MTEAEKAVHWFERARVLSYERDRYREALAMIATWAEYGYQDLNSGGVLSCVKKRAKDALGEVD